MTTLINIILVTSIWCLGITIATQKDMVLHFIRRWAEQKDSKWFEPIVICPWCMPSIHSLIGYSFCFATEIVTVFNWNIVLMYPIVVCGSSVVTGVIWSVYKMIEVKTKHLTNIESLSHFDLKERKEQYKRKKNISYSG